MEEKETMHIPEERIETKGIVRELHVLHPNFRNRVIKLIYECKKQGIELKIVETYRNHERQDSLKKRGFSTLRGGCSKHQYNLAVDVVPIINGRAIWNNHKLWSKIGKIGEEQGLRWGGRWRRFVDKPHFEYPCPIEEIHTIPIPDTVLIPEPDYNTIWK